MRIVEKDFVMKSCSYGLFDLIFIDKVKDEETGEVQVKTSKPFYGGTLSQCIKKINRHRINTKYEGESLYLLEALNEIIKLDKEITKLCKECIPENFDTGG